MQDALQVTLRDITLSATVIVMTVTALPHVPRVWLDYSRLPILNRLDQPEAYGTDTIADMYAARVVQNDPLDMYTKAGVEQTPLEGALRERGIPFEAVDVDENPGAYAIAKKAAGANVIPLTNVVRGPQRSWIVGANVDAVERACKGD